MIVWVKRKYGGRITSRKIYNKCWVYFNDHRVFGVSTRNEKGKLKCDHLPKYSDIFSGYSIVKYIKVRKAYSIYDTNEASWAQRATYAVEMKLKISLSKKQKHKCALCKMWFQPGDILEVDHIIPKSMKGSNKMFNLRLVHGHCYD